MVIGDKIRQLRESHKMTQRELGAIIGVSDKAVSTWENGSKTPRLTAIVKIADYFGIRTGELMSDPMPYTTEDNPFGKQLAFSCLSWGCTPEQVARDLNIPPTRIHGIIEGDIPTEAEAYAIAAYFRKPVSILQDGTSPLTPDLYNVSPVSVRASRRIPVLGRVPAGVPIEAITDVVEEIDLTDTTAHDGYDYFGLLVTGDSMFPEYLDGDIVILRMQPTAQTGDDVVAYIGGGDATLKRLTITENGIQLRPLNPMYEVKSFNHQEIRSLPVTIAGIVVEQRRRRKHG